MLISSTTSKADDIQKNLNDVKCLALNIYHEARDQSEEGMSAVAQVTLNRAKQSSSSVCDVVYSPYQFSWTRHKPKINEKQKLTEIYNLAFDEYFQYDSNNDGSVYYHTVTVNPSWSRSKKKTKIVGRHIFYKEK